jgi:hypothetical protein
VFLRLRARPAWRTTVVVWTLMAIFVFLEGFARAALLLHWPFDVPGAWLLGILLLTTMIAASSVFVGSYFPPRPGEPSPSSPRMDASPAGTAKV